MNNIKILHIADMHMRHNGRLFYSSVKKINNGFIKNNFNVLQISDRDNLKGNILNYKKKSFIKTIYSNIDNFDPDIILFGHVDSLNQDDFYNIKLKYKKKLFSQWFLDSLDPSFVGHQDHLKRFFLKYQICDTNFITTNPEDLNFVDKDKTFFIPNMSDESIDVLENYKFDNLKFDLFFALSHGQHRGILKKGFIDERYDFLNFFKDKNIKTNFFGTYRQPVWGSNFFDELSKSKMGLNLNRGNKIKYYSSDRICSLMANGLTTFLQDGYFYNDFFKENEDAIYFTSKEELLDKVIFYSKNDNERKKIGFNGKKKYFDEFNNVVVTKFMINKIIGSNNYIEKRWMR